MRDGEKGWIFKSRRDEGVAAGSVAFVLALFAVRNAVEDEPGMFLFNVVLGGINAFNALRILSSPSPAPADKEG